MKSKNIQGVEVIAGNIATGEGRPTFVRKGLMGLEQVSEMSLCETRIRTGVGVPQVSALLDIVNVCDKFDVPVIADGGIRYIGDVCKGLACGAWIRLCWGVCYQVLKKLQVPLRK